MNRILYQLEKVRIQQFGKTIFDQLDFTIREGETWAVVGAAGAGKTSLLRALAGQLPVTGGFQSMPFYDDYKAARIASGSDEDSLSPLFTWRNLISLVDTRHHFTNLSNTEDFYYQQRYNSCDAEDAPTVSTYLNQFHSPDDAYWTYEKLIGRLNLRELADKEVILLSNGETKRLLLAAALIRHPKFLLLDSPLSGLDKASRANFNRLLEEIRDSGIHILLTVSPLEIPDCVTHVAHLETGRIRYAGPRYDWDPSTLPVTGVGSSRDKIAEWLQTGSIPEYEEIIRLTECRVQYGARVILDDINWVVKQGERWALVGHNGAGKSTLLSLITGDNPQAYANNICLFGKKRGTGESIWDLKKKIGYVSPELFQYFPQDTTVAQAVESGLYDTIGLFRAPSASHQDKVRSIMDALGLAPYANQLLRHTATSIQRICLVARALVKFPPLLILDEPCQGMDNHQIAEFKELIDLICDQTPLTLIYVSHYDQEIPGCITKKLILSKGQRVE
jgi:molybdate transport system ATP-binding protein